MCVAMPFQPRAHTADKALAPGRLSASRVEHFLSRGLRYGKCQRGGCLTRPINNLGKADQLKEITIIIDNRTHYED